MTEKLIIVIFFLIVPLTSITVQVPLACPLKRLLNLHPFLPLIPAMRWPRMTRKSRGQSDTEIFRPTTNTTSGDTAQDVSHDDLSLKAPYMTDPGLSRMFTDAALYERVLNAGPEALKNCLALGSEERALPACVGSFNELVGRDLADNERLVTGRLAKLSVNNWAASTDDSFGVDALTEEDQEEVASSEGRESAQDEKRPSLFTAPTLQEEQPDEPKLTPEEIVDLLEQEFGALAPPGEEKLLLETDGAFFKDVVVLVGLSSHTLHVPYDVGLRFTDMTYSGCHSRHHTPMHLSCFALIVSAGLQSKSRQVWQCPNPPQRIA